MLKSFAARAKAVQALSISTVQNMYPREVPTEVTEGVEGTSSFVVIKTCGPSSH